MFLISVVLLTFCMIFLECRWHSSNKIFPFYLAFHSLCRGIAFRKSTVLTERRRKSSPPGHGSLLCGVILPQVMWILLFLHFCFNWWIYCYSWLGYDEYSKFSLTWTISFLNFKILFLFPSFSFNFSHTVRLLWDQSQSGKLGWELCPSDLPKSEMTPHS